MSTLVVGQKLWLVPSYSGHGAPREVSVVSVGRKWATLDCWNNARIDLETLEIGGKDDSSLGRCYLSRDEHESTMRLRHIWIDFRRHVEGLYDRPKVATEANMRLAADLLGIQLIQE